MRSCEEEAALADARLWKEAIMREEPTVFDGRWWSVEVIRRMMKRRGTVRMNEEEK